MPEVGLLYPLPYIKYSNCLSYGGNQTLSDDTVLRKSGCGVISCADTLIYLARHHNGCKKGIFCNLPEPDTEFIPIEYYNERIKELSRRFLPIVPGLGINGPALALGLNRYFGKYDIPFRAHWELRCGRLWQSINDMLRHDIPVIISVGPNFPLIWQKYRLTLYAKTSSGEYRPQCSTKSHFVTAVSLDDIWLGISSWGKKYYIRRSEYDAYLKKHSASLVNSAVYIKPVR